VKRPAEWLFWGKARQRTGFDYAVARRVILEPAPTRAELDVLRAYDPDRLFLRDRRPWPTPTAAITKNCSARLVAR